MDQPPPHFDGPMIAGGLSHTLDEVLLADRPIAFGTDVPGLDAITGGIEPGAMWAVDGASGIGVTAFALHLARAVGARGGVVVVANGHVASRALARRLSPVESGAHSTSARITSWIGLPNADREWWSTECSAADLVVLDTIEEMWRPAGAVPEQAPAVTHTRLLREVARASNTAVIVTGRRMRDGRRPVGAEWLPDLLDEVADVRLELVANPASGVVGLLVRSRRDGRRYRLSNPLSGPVLRSEGSDPATGSMPYSTP